MVWERIPSDGWRAQRGHVERYELAATLIQPGDTVLDAACGIGYGATVLAEEAPAHTYWGADREPAELLDADRFLQVDLDTWEPDFGFDVAVCFETLEHLADPARFASILLRASRLVVASVPTVPTKATNPYHLHDFTVDTAAALFTSGRIVDVIPQPAEVSHIFIIETGAAA